MGGIGIWQLLIVLIIVMLLFGTKKLRNIGNDLGGAIKSFRKAVKDGEEVKKESEDENEKLTTQDSGRVFDGEVTSKEKEKEKEKS